MSVILVAALIARADPSALARTRITTPGEPWVGQRVTLVVELLSPGPFASAPAFDLPTVPGVLLLEPDDRPTLDTEDVGGVSYTLQRHEFAVFAQRAGRVTLPAFPVRFESSNGFGKPTTDHRVMTQPVSFTAKLPPGAEGLATVVTTPNLTLKETWTPDPGPAAVGAAFTRTITVEAADVPGMALPAFRFDPPAGFRAYPKAPVVEDRVDRGSLTGRRVETTAYVCEAAGTYTLPALALSWWEPAGRVLNRASLPGRTFTVTAPPAPPPEAAPEPPAPTWPWAWGMLALVVAAAGGWWGWTRWSRPDPERECYRQFRQACQSADAPAAYRALVAWLDHALPSNPPPTPAGFAARSADPALGAAVAALEAAVFARPDGPNADWSPAELVRLVSAARTGLRESAGARRPALPPLNPIAPSPR